MKNFTRLFGVIILLMLTISATAQTNVSGGIYTNTTWTKVNSPYIVVDTVVVFPGVTLTIEPGVVVKFIDKTWLEIRQGTLIANGTGADSITFTSNSISPYPGIYYGPTLKGPLGLPSQFNYCNFRYADYGLNTVLYLAIDTILIKNSNFNYNVNGLHPSSTNIFIDSSNFRYNKYSGLGFSLGGRIGYANFCNISHNLIGIGGNVEPMQGGTFINCTIDSNDIGAYSDAGNTTPALFQNCKIDSNQTGIKTSTTLGGVIIEYSTFCSNGTAINGDVGVSNSGFSMNHIGVLGNDPGLSGNIFTNNDTALLISGGSLINNVIHNNVVGVLYEYHFSNLNLVNNNICNNTLYNLQMISPSNIVFANTCWCDSDSTRIAAKIYDGYDNITLGLVNFSPFIKCDSSVLAGIPAVNCPTVIITQVDESRHLIAEAFTIYPNPASDNITLKVLKDISQAKCKIYNILGELKYSSTIERQLTTIDISSFATGVYVFEVIADNKSFKGKFIKSNP